MIHFIAGLPRSGSTLLAAILRQNPRFHSVGMTSPISTIFRAIEDATSGRNEGSVFVSPEQRDLMLTRVFEAYYPADRVVFDTSRMWCARLPVLARLFPRAKVIACVRELGWIADSFERLYRKNGQAPSGIYGWDTGGTVWSRTSALMEAGGVAGYAINAVQEAVASEEAEGRLMLLDYEALCRDPKAALGEIYEFINEPLFPHDFEHVEHEAGEFDRQIGAQGLHTVNGAVAWRPRKTILPQRLFDQFNGPNFWRA